MKRHIFITEDKFYVFPSTIFFAVDEEGIVTQLSGFDYCELDADSKYTFYYDRDFAEDYAKTVKKAYFTTDHILNLEKAGALIAAEIDRLLNKKVTDDTSAA